jgi:hypothetical protein
VTIAISSLLVHCFLSCGVLFLIVSICLLVCLLVCYDLRVEELSISAGDQKNRRSKVLRGVDH